MSIQLEKWDGTMDSKRNCQQLNKTQAEVSQMSKCHPNTKEQKSEMVSKVAICFEFC
jgi:hypothetical protein